MGRVRYFTTGFTKASSLGGSSPKLAGVAKLYPSLGDRYLGLGLQGDASLYLGFSAANLSGLGACANLGGGRGSNSSRRRQRSSLIILSPMARLLIWNVGDPWFKSPICLSERRDLAKNLLPLS